MKKLVALAVAGAVGTIVAGWRRVQRDTAITTAPEGPAERAAAPKPKPSASGPSPSGGGPSLMEPTVGPGSTKAELYEVAQQLEIEGRSSMSKAELLDAIRDAG